MRKNRMLSNQQGFTLIEIIAVLVLLGILAAVAVPKYMDLTNTAREKAAAGQIAEVKGRLSSALNGYMLANNGRKPGIAADGTGSLDAATLVTYLNTGSANACPTSSFTEGDFTFVCSSAGAVVTITVTAVQGNNLTTSQLGTFTIQ